MRIAMISGQERGLHVASLAAALTRLGSEVVVYTRREDPDIAPVAEMYPGVRVEQIPAGPQAHVQEDELFSFMPEFASRLEERLSRFRPEVIHAHFWTTAWAALEVGGRLRIPVVTTFHALGENKKKHGGAKVTARQQRAQAEARVVRESSHIIATSTEEMAELRRRGAGAERVSIVPGGVDVNLFNPTVPKSDVKRHRNRVAAVSGLAERKGTVNLIEALTFLPDTELVIAGGPHISILGEDPDAGRLMQLARKHRVDERVIFKGSMRREEVPRLMRSADVVACVPWYEPFGTVAAQAMACGVPVVATSVGALRDTVIHGVTGIIVEPRKPAELAKALTALFLDDVWRKKLGRGGAARASELYSWKRVSLMTLRTYRNVIDKASLQSRGEPENDSSSLKTVLVTGGASGLGASVADEIEAAGGKPVILDRIRPRNGHDHILVDIADSAAAERAVTKVIRKHGDISAVVICAATGASGPIDKVSRADWDRVISVNLSGTAAVIRAALPPLIKTRGRVVTVTSPELEPSTLGLKGVEDATAYCASKFGVIGFTRALAAETQGRIGVTLLIPGADATPSEPANVAAAVLSALRQPVGGDIHELVVRPSTESSWP